ncbi:histidine phosphatase family protein [Periweissella beninensis]|uniref:Histidine phosphatase family protein n=1 Tax=Periweissella beninensis TaxID=504936 RepID=A0ABT0VHD7_9LACO|nr:histidine phosphatase family protein [Periweissella beninensis]MBM7543571.1 putative phosphoglycerate mutase [Periweissella beninensis]MCM2436553.1 histidine phosphatase family protein [Periweissella beninensis]MCT4396270.1 histidine phosphatase family protein [Periweissella beninensis]
MTKVYFVRHGKTEWNLEGRYQGANGDSNLLPESYSQISQLGQYLKTSKIKFNHVYASPIKRARQTALGLWPYLNGNPNLSLRSGLKEFALGSWEGQSFEWVKDKYPILYEGFRYNPQLWDGSKIGAESFESVMQRFGDTVKLAVNNHDNDANLLFISHGAAITAGIGSLLGTPLADIRARGGISNTSLTVLETTDNQIFTEIVRNQTNYLTAEQTANDTI